MVIIKQHIFIIINLIKSNDIFNKFSWLNLRICNSKQNKRRINSRKEIFQHTSKLNFNSINSIFNNKNILPWNRILYILIDGNNIKLFYQKGVFIFWISLNY